MHIKVLLRNVMEQQWLIQPEALKQEKKISQLYEKIRAADETGGRCAERGRRYETRFPETAAEVRGNIEFMNQLNQAYTYVQVPLKMSGQNANGELYVYTNKKNLRDPDAELSAFFTSGSGTPWLYRCLSENAASECQNKFLYG